VQGRQGGHFETPSKLSHTQPESCPSKRISSGIPAFLLLAGEILGCLKLGIPEYAFRMFPGGRLFRTFSTVALVFACASVPLAQTGTSPSAQFVADGLGKGAVSIDGNWQFHQGDDLSWANAEFDDTTGHNGWEQISADKPWGAQGHKGYTGFAWYRRRVSITMAPGASPDVALYLPVVSDAYQVFWNGVLVGQFGRLPPHPVWYYSPPPQTMGLGQARSGVLAVRVWNAALSSNDSDEQGGFTAAPSIGSSAAIGALKTASDYRWLSRMEARLILDVVYLLMGLIALIAWLSHREQMLWFWVAITNITIVVVEGTELFRFPIPSVVSIDLIQPLFAVIFIGTWYTLALLLCLEESRFIWRSLRLLSIAAMACCVLDAGATYGIHFGTRKLAASMQGADWALTAIFTPLQFLPTLLVLCAVFRRRHLAVVRWVVAIFALLSNLVPVLQGAAQAASRFAPLRWFSDLLLRPVFIINGAAINPQTLTAFLLLFVTVFAAYRVTRDERLRQIAVEQEFRSARELQRVLIPDAQPLTPGYAFTSSYKPASEVGGDFFQVITLEGDATLIVLGDVSGKGLKAAMAVSLIVGMVRALTRIFPEPGKLLAEINERLAGSLHGAFATAIALHFTAQGQCTVASAGHLSPFVNDRELELPGALPLGISTGNVYEEIQLQLQEADHLAIYTDGLLEARNANGELYGFERLHVLFTTRPDAARASEAAVNFGQDDDITVLTLTRLGQRDATAAQLPSAAMSPA
jgi:hypothetical protein